MTHAHDAIQRLAYRSWEARGCPLGSPEVDWSAAERQLAAEESNLPNEIDETLRETFPASDPPASRIPDEPPSNAETQWAAAGISRASATPKARAKKAGKR